ncbi:MAG: glycine cleavage system protein GcvH [Peptostreptococcaceae bacterium]|nr:glycine cleavage system protein GcvH [Peptostreptococcaceae bacterium]
MKIMEGYYYTKEHEWISVKGNVGTIGISDYAQHALGDIVFVDLPEEEESFDRGEAFGAIESVKAASDTYLPVGGTVIEINESLEDEPGLINVDCYENWIVKIEIADLSELDELMDSAEYEAHISEEE